MSRPVPFRAVLRSEGTKLASLRSTWWAAAGYVLVAGGFGWLAASTNPSADSADSALRIALIGFGFAQFAVVAVAVVAATGEFASGSVLASLAAVPRRVRWLAAKTGVVAGAVAVLTGVLTLVCWLAARTLTAVPGGVPLGGAVARDVLLQVAGAALTAVLAVGLGTLLRSTAGGVAAGVALVFLAPLLLPLFGSTGEWLAEAMPVLRVGADPFLVAGTTGPVGLAVTAAWAVGTWALAAVLLVRRDL